jgi:CDP-6-deoxy-D-xylo-4-hexulose-3-dehydrase
MKKDQYKYLSNLINIFKKKESNQPFYSLTGKPFENEDLVAGIETILSGRITMSEITKRFEYKFSNYINSKYALMVNSGSSANLLAFFSLINPKNKTRLNQRDECLIPALCWSTSLWPIIQAGLKPKFIDVDVNTFNINLDDLEKKITKKTKAILAVHVLGNSANMEKLLNISKKYNLILIEDTCESLGSKYKNKFLGTFGRYGTYSFFVSHQLIAGEGGMLVCNDKKDYEIAYSLRAHGWDRGLKNNKNFNFINSGFNLRPLDVTASIGLSQLNRLSKSINIRNRNRKKLLQSIKSSPKWKNQITFLEPIKNLKPSWFGLPVLIDKKFLKKKNNYLKFLNNCGVETRPIISGNFLNQPSVKLYNLNPKNKIFPGAQEIEDRGFFIGLHTESIDNAKIKKLTDILLSVL